MDYLDVRISELVSENQAHLLRSSQPHGFRGVMRQMMQSRLRALARITFVVVALFLLGAIWTAYSFYEATDTLMAVKYGLTAATLAILAVVLQVGLVPHLQAERLIRALKRVEILLLSRPN